MQALPHFGAAVVELHAAIQIHQHQRTALVQMLGSEGDAKLHRCQRDAFFQVSVACVELRDGAAARFVVDALFEFADEFIKDIVFDRHAEGRDVALGNAIKIGLANFERILAQTPRDLLDHFLDADHALRPAEAAKRGVRRLVREAALRCDAQLVEEIRVVRVRHRTVGDRMR